MRRILLAGAVLLAAAASFATLAAGGTTVDIYLAVGPKRGGESCDPEENGNCEIWRVRLPLGSKTATKVDRIVERPTRGETTFGVLQPALSPNGLRLAWVARAKGASQLWGMIVDEGKGRILVDGESKTVAGSKLKPEWPEWLTDATLLYDAKTGDSEGIQLKTVYSVEVASLSSPGTPVARFGSAVDANSLGDQDPAVRRAGGEAEVVTFGPAKSGSDTIYEPRVRTVSGNGALKTAAVLPFSLGSNSTGAAIKECHHPAWNPSGERVMCMVQRPTESVKGVATRVLYSYKYNEGNRSWTAEGRTFTPLPVDQWGIDASRLFSDCNAINYKYAQWCGSEDYVVTTLYCAGKSEAGDRGAPVLASRVVLVRTGTTEYTDITRLVEKERSLDAGGLQGFTATCGAAR